jgi:hypothetical protein
MVQSAVNLHVHQEEEDPLDLKTILEESLLYVQKRLVLLFSVRRVLRHSGISCPLNSGSDETRSRGWRRGRILPVSGREALGYVFGPYSQTKETFWGLRRQNDFVCVAPTGVCFLPRESPIPRFSASHAIFRRGYARNVIRSVIDDFRPHSDRTLALWMGAAAQSDDGTLAAVLYRIYFEESGTGIYYRNVFWTPLWDVDRMLLDAAAAAQRIVTPKEFHAEFLRDATMRRAYYLDLQRSYGFQVQGKKNSSADR